MRQPCIFGGYASSSAGWDFVSGLIGVGLAILGPIWVYKKNGGIGGTHFLQRFLAIGVHVRDVAIGLPDMPLQPTSDAGSTADSP